MMGLIMRARLIMTFFVYPRIIVICGKCVCEGVGRHRSTWRDKKQSTAWKALYVRVLHVYRYIWTPSFGERLSLPINVRNAHDSLIL